MSKEKVLCEIFVDLTVIRKHVLCPVYVSWSSSCWSYRTCDIPKNTNLTLFYHTFFNIVLIVKLEH